MEPFGQSFTDQSEPRIASNFFARVPFRSYYFIAGTVMMGINLVIVGLIAVRFWSRMPALAMAEVGLAVVAMLVLWNRAYLTCRKLHEVYSEAKMNASFARSPLDTTLRNAAAITGASLSFSFFTAGWLLLALGSALRSR
jgi:hypothetical protein